jgi:hypothetical protein
MLRLQMDAQYINWEWAQVLDDLGSPPVFNGFRVTRSLVLYVCFVDRCLSVCIFLLAIVLSVLLQFMDSDYSFGYSSCTDLSTYD